LRQELASGRGSRFEAAIGIAGLVLIALRRRKRRAARAPKPDRDSI
jgi:hypothetical protein